MASQKRLSQLHKESLTLEQALVRLTDKEVSEKYVQARDAWIAGGSKVHQFAIAFRNTAPERIREMQLYRAYSDAPRVAMGQLQVGFKSGKYIATGRLVSNMTEIQEFPTPSWQQLTVIDPIAGTAQVAKQPSTKIFDIRVRLQGMASASEKEEAQPAGELSRSTAARRRGVEEACLAMLKKPMAASPLKRIGTRAEWRERARELVDGHLLSDRQFESIWKRAMSETEALWDTAGAPRKLARQ